MWCCVILECGAVCCLIVECGAVCCLIVECGMSCAVVWWSAVLCCAVCSVFSDVLCAVCYRDVLRHVVLYERRICVHSLKVH